MSTKETLQELTKAEKTAKAAFKKAQKRTQAARIQYTENQLKERGIELNKTRVYVLNRFGEEVPAIISAICTSGNAICREILEGNALKEGIVATCPIDYIRNSPAVRH